jgi:prepilin-type N-terminal cleavage/methylation domain-containing protein
MRKAFTLIELLVVIAIIAILAAILFPVFAQAKMAAKKTQGLAQSKQIGTSTQIYIADYDDTFFPYRLNGPTGTGCTGANCINPDYQKMRIAQGVAAADAFYGARARDVIFFKQMLDPYVKNDQIWRAPNHTYSWVGTVGDDSQTEPQFKRYGGQNSYGVNNYAFTAPAGSSSSGGGVSATAVVDVSNTLLMVDASYYNVLPRYTARLTGATGTFDPCSSSYPRYWKNLGNSYLFRYAGAANEPTDAEALKLIDSRYSGQLNVIRFDTSAKSIASTKVMNDLRDNPNNSMWDPWKAGVTTVCP